GIIMAIVTPRRREFELVKEAAERVAHRTRSKFVWNEKQPEVLEKTSDDREVAGQSRSQPPVKFD
ncbi:MAG: hypothetical protein Q7U92_07565, partial [Bradyrhizobium sp.]|nr:hypothetical protein [Bradyrhizobium sp.]